MQQTAQQWLVYRLTRSSFHLSIVGFVTFLPVLLFAPLAGVLLDRASKLRSLIIAQTTFLLLAVILAGLTFTDVIQYWHIVLLAFLLGLADTIEKPARQSLIIDLVGRSDLVNAISLHASVFNVARIVGPAAAGVIVGRLGEAAAFSVNALSYVPVILALLSIRLISSIHIKPALNTLGQIKEGFRHAQSDTTTFMLMAMVFLLAFSGIPYIALLPIFAGDVLGLGSEGFGLLFSASGIGAVIGGISLAFLGDFRRKEFFVTGAMLTFAVALLIFSRSHSVPLSLAMLAIIGGAQICHLATANSLLQVRSPDRLRGRIMSIFVWVHGSALTLGTLLLGALAHLLGPQNAVMLSAFACGISALFFGWRLVNFSHSTESSLSQDVGNRRLSKKG